MDEYIKREAVIDRLKRNLDACNPGSFSELCYRDAIETVKCFPAADVAPVVHGRWEKHYRSGTPVAEGYVSTCCDMWNNRKSDYCPFCGAIMEGSDS